MRRGEAVTVMREAAVCGFETMAQMQGPGREDWAVVVLPEWTVYREAHEAATRLGWSARMAKRIESDGRRAFMNPIEKRECERPASCPRRFARVVCRAWRGL